MMQAEGHVKNGLPQRHREKGGTEGRAEAWHYVRVTAEDGFTWFAGVTYNRQRCWCWQICLRGAEGFGVDRETKSGKIPSDKVGTFGRFAGNDERLRG